MLNREEYADLKRTLAAMDPDALLDLLRIDSETLLEMAENYDPMLIEDCADRVGVGEADTLPHQQYSSKKTQPAKQ